MWVLFEGAFVLARTVQEPGIAAAQLYHYRCYLELLLGGDVRGVSAPRRPRRRADRRSAGTPRA